MKDWLKPTGDLISAIGDDSFPETLANALKKIAVFDYTVAFGYLGTTPPLVLFDTFPKKKRKVFVEDYQEGPYLLDPFFLATTTSIPSGLHRLKEIAPDRFYQGEYFRSYYVQTGLAEEIGFLVDLPGDAMVVISLMRANKPFSAKDIRELRHYWPIVCAAAQRHWADLSTRIEGNSSGRRTAGMERSIQRAFQSFGGGILTPREREVAEYTLKGYSADAIGKILNIASGTVRIHRKNIYAKLRISSQGELFSKFIVTLSGRNEVDA
ncbi:MAG: LuxR family transcriptional regulator [Sphingomonadales bacterium]|nr:MAG: LuxR family transcriptional regulator [Sphingomonadales bacterium]